MRVMKILPEAYKHHALDKIMTSSLLNGPGCSQLCFRPKQGILSVQSGSKCWQHKNGPQALAAGAAIASTPATENSVRVSNRIPLPAGEIHLWWLEADEVQSKKLLEQYLAMLPESEQSYVGEGANEAVQKERLLARTLVRAVLTRYCEGDVPCRDLQFEYSPGGKPWLVSEQLADKTTGQLHFNLTHTDRLLGVAVSRCGFVGLDTENSSRLTKFKPASLAKRRFSDREYSVLTGFENPAEQQRLFIRLWCLKEAYVKATGRGIMAHPGLKAFTFELLLNIKTRPSRYRPPISEPVSGKENTPPAMTAASAAPQEQPPTPWKYSMDEQSHSFGREGRGREGAGVVWGPESRAPFALQLQPPEVDEMAWETWLMELCGGHTAALVAESGKRWDSPQSVESRPALQLKCFKTVPLMFEEQADSRYCRVIGYGHSLLEM